MTQDDWTQREPPRIGRGWRDVRAELICALGHRSYEELGTVAAVDAAFDGALAPLLKPTQAQAVLAWGREAMLVAEDFWRLRVAGALVVSGGTAPAAGGWQLWSRFDQCSHLPHWAEASEALANRGLTCGLAWVDGRPGCSTLAQGLLATLDLLRTHVDEGRGLFVCRFTAGEQLATQQLLALAVSCFRQWAVAKPLHVPSIAPDLYVAARHLRPDAVPPALAALRLYQQRPGPATLWGSLPNATAFWHFREALSLPVALAQRWAEKTRDVPASALGRAALARYARPPAPPLAHERELVLKDPGYWCRLSVPAWQALCAEQPVPAPAVGTWVWLCQYLGAIARERPGAVALALPAGCAYGRAGFVWAADEGVFWLPRAAESAAAPAPIATFDQEVREWLPCLLGQRPARTKLLAALAAASQPVRELALPPGTLLVVWRSGGTEWVLDVLHWPAVAAQLAGATHGQRLALARTLLLPSLAQPGGLVTAREAPGADDAFVVSLPLRTTVRPGPGVLAREWYP